MGNMEFCPIFSDFPFDDLKQSIQRAYKDETQNYPWIVGFSGGKDSTLVAHLIFEAIMRIAPKLRTRKIYFISNDTLVENPFVVQQVEDQFIKIKNTAKCFSLPISTVISKPELVHTFWVLLIGKGYPTPNMKMRWCTDRLKIRPTSQFILNNVSEYGAAIVVLGVRKDESSSRKRSIEKYKDIDNSYLTPHSSLSGAYIYRPIRDLLTSDVWYYISQNDPPWGGTHEKLIQMYRDADGGECPFVLSKDESPGCGTNSSRFGCWVCTVVTKDRSLQGMVESSQEKYQSLIDFRDWLQAIRNNSEYRQARRRNGQFSFKTDGALINGPFTMKARREILDNLLKTQDSYGNELITTEEINKIKEIWAEEISQKIM